MNKTAIKDLQAGMVTAMPVHSKTGHIEFLRSQGFRLFEDFGVDRAFANVVKKAGEGQYI